MCGFIGRHPGGTQLSEDVWFYRPPPGGGRVLSSVNMCGFNFIGRHPDGEGTQLSEHVWFHRPPPGGEGTQLSEHVWFYRPPPGWGGYSAQ